MKYQPGDIVYYENEDIPGVVLRYVDGAGYCVLFRDLRYVDSALKGPFYTEDCLHPHPDHSTGGLE